MSYFFQENQWGERYIDSVNRDAFAGLPSSDYFDRYLELQFTQDDTLYIIVGSDSGLLVRHVLTMPLGRGSTIAFVEPDELYEIIAPELGSQLCGDSKQQSGNHTQRISLHSQSNWQDQLFAEDQQKWFLGGQVCILQSRACQLDYNQIYLPFLREVSAATEETRSDAVNRLGSKVFIATQIQNAADNVYPLCINPEFGKGKTAIILGGSPSLDRFIDWITDNRERLFIIAVSRLCGKLSSLSLMPDILISIDPFSFSYDVCKHGVLWKDVPLLNGYHVVPKLLQEWQGPKLYLGHRLPWQSEHNSPNAISAGGPTVSHTAAVVASQLGFSQILLCGVDLCYTSNLNTHTSDTPEALFQKLPSLCDAQVETYSGRMAGTSSGLLHTCKSMETIGQAINEYADVLFNISEDAARLDSIRYLNVQDVLLPDEKPDFSTLVRTLSDSDCLKDLQSLSQQLHHAKKGFRLINKACKKARLHIDAIYHTKHTGKSQLDSDGLNLLDKKMERQAKIYFDAIRNYASTDFYMLRKPSGFNDMNPEEMEAWITEYYSIISTSSKEFLKLIGNLEHRISIRQHELSSMPDINYLLDAWENDHSQGRVLSFVDKLRPIANDQENKRLETATNNFTQFVSEANTKAVKQLKGFNEDIGNCMRSLIFLFNNNSIEELNSICRNLQAASGWPYEALYLFTKGLSEEANHQNTLALGSYNCVIECCTTRLETTDDSLPAMQRLLEESLVRITQITLNAGDYVSACTTLGTLCEMCPQYILSYANLLNLTGNSPAAIDLLDCYIENYPENWRAAVLKSDIYQSLGDTAQASTALELSKHMRLAAAQAQKLRQVRQAA